MKLLQHLSILLCRCALAALLGTVASAAGASDETGELGRAPDFALRTLDGEEVSRASLNGKVVVVNFWATWCPDCMNALPTYIALQKQFGDEPDFVFLAVSLDKEPAEFVRKFSDRHQINYRIAMGDEALTKAFGGIGEIPTTFIIDRAGMIRFKQAGSIALESVSRLLRSLL
jgi:thiol-disulfide isomerase/thioredoxin